MNEQNFYSTRNARIRSRVLEVPLGLRAFYASNCLYTLQEIRECGYRLLIIAQKQALNEDTQNSTNLETVVRKNGARGLRLPQSSLTHLDLQDSSKRKYHKVKIIGDGSYFEVWKPEDFQIYQSKERIEDLLSLLENEGIFVRR